MKQKKRKSFYNNKHRNEKWTEQVQGRKIDFADKYAYTDGYSDKYDETTRHAHQAALRKRERASRGVKRLVAIVLALVLISIGYIGMDTHIIRYSKPARAMLEEGDNGYGTMSQLDISLNSVQIDSISLDDSSMLDSVIEDARSLGCNSVTFDAKRTDGTIGYDSQLATVDTYGARSSFGAEPAKSISRLIANDILPVARICCYMDNIVPSQSKELAFTKDGKLFKDKDGSTYLNPSNPTCYDYIKDIVTELYDYGVTVFVLTGCDIPEEAGEVKNDGFTRLARELSLSLSGEAKLINEVDVNLKGLSKGDVKKRIKGLEAPKSNEAYYIISGTDDKKMLDMLSQSKAKSFIIA